MISLHSRVHSDSCAGQMINICKDIPLVLEGKQELETLLPVSKLTGRRQDPLELLKMQFSKDSRLLDALLQELPVIQADSSISDEDKFSVLASRLSTGSLYENDVLVKELEKVADVLFPEQVEKSEQVIEFAATDAVNAANESAE